MSKQPTPRRYGEYGAGRDQRIEFRLSESERDELLRMAEAEGLSLAEYLRAHLLRERGSIIRPKAKT